jgi:hypothetical protein
LRKSNIFILFSIIRERKERMVGRAFEAYRGLAAQAQIARRKKEI